MKVSHLLKFAASLKKLFSDASAYNSALEAWLQEAERMTGT
jgi:hypothetical protein